MVVASVLDQQQFRFPRLSVVFVLKQVGCFEPRPGEFEYAHSKVVDVPAPAKAPEYIHHPFLILLVAVRKPLLAFDGYVDSVVPGVENDKLPSRKAEAKHFPLFPAKFRARNGGIAQRFRYILL